jgi:gas vesicle protein
MRTFLFGLVMGAVAGVLYAPATGNRTRSLLRDKFTRYRSEAADMLDSKSRDLSNRLEGAKYRATTAMDEIKEQANKVQGAVQTGMNQAREQVGQVRDQVQESIKQKDQKRSA